MTKEREFSESCSICQMFRPVFRFGINIGQSLIMKKYPHLPDMSEMFLCPTCLVILIQKGLWKLEYTRMKPKDVFKKINELWKMAKAAREERLRLREEQRRTFALVRRQSRETREMIERIEGQTDHLGTTRRQRRRQRTPAGSTDEDPLGW